MRYEVGDTIRIREDLATAGEHGDFENTVGYNDEMAEYVGRTMTVTSVHHNGNGLVYYYCEEDNGNWMWSEDMLTVTEIKEEEERPVYEHTAVTQINREQIIKEMYDTLDICRIYSPTDEGLNAIVDEWERKKGKTDIWNGMSALDILAKHPDYVPEKGYIVKRNEYDRGIDEKVILDVLQDIVYISENPRACGLLEEINIRPWSYAEIVEYAEKLNGIALALLKDKDNMSWKGMKYDDVLREASIWEKRRDILEKEYFVEYRKCYSKEEKDKYRKIVILFIKIKEWVINEMDNMETEDLNKPLLITDRVVEIINNSGVTVRGIRAGQKFNKVIIKILTETGIKDKWREYNRQTARLGDAASPTKFTRFTIISANPIDFWRMSFGSSWKSCHTIDKMGYYSPSDGGDGYEGMHASGPSSYMLDSSSLIMYTVDKSYTGSDYELEPKINRCMFHLGEGKFIMGRVYPQGTDGEDEVYKQWRQIFQTIIAECMGVTNYWKTEKDLDVKRRQYRSSGTHYRDYECGYCNNAGWSYLKPNADSRPSDRIIYIGHDPICPHCGAEHCEEDNLECECCRNDNVECCHCGYSADRDDMILIDGDWYCQDCCFYCDYHEEWEVGDDYYRVEGYGNVCYDAINYSGDFRYCEYCEQYYYDTDGVETEDGTWFCCEDCANNADYVYVESKGGWYPQDETVYCDRCEEYVLEDDYDETHHMCNECWQNVENSEEEIA